MKRTLICCLALAVVAAGSIAISAAAGKKKNKGPYVLKVDKDGFPAKRAKIGAFAVKCECDDETRGARMTKKVAEFWTTQGRGKFTLRYVKSGHADFKFRVDTSKHGNNMTVQSQYLYTVGFHEMGHKLGLGHSRVDALATKGYRKGKTDNDNTTIMNGHANGAHFLVAPQYYVLGWLPAEEVALYKEGADNTFELKRISDFTGKGLSTVIVMPSAWKKANPTNGRALYISFGTEWKDKGFTLHLEQDGGTTRIVTGDTKEYFDVQRNNGNYTGIHIKMLPNDDPKKIKIKVDFARPAAVPTA